MGFIDWIKGAAGWVHNNVIKPVLSGASWVKNSFLNPVINFASKLPVVGPYAKIASTAINVLDGVNQMVNRPSQQQQQPPAPT